jgi:hypothetical protein
MATLESALTDLAQMGYSYVLVLCTEPDGMPFTGESGAVNYKVRVGGKLATLSIDQISEVIRNSADLLK